MNNSKKYILLLVALLSGTFLYGELRYKFPGWNQHINGMSSGRGFSLSEKELVDTYENIISFNYDDSCIVVLKGPVDIFLSETYRFDHGFDAVKYWYDKKVFYIELDSHGFPDVQNNIRVISGGTSELVYLNGDRLRETRHNAETVLTHAEIFSNQMIISKAHIGDSARRVIELLDLETPVPTKGLRSIVLSYSADVVSYFRYFVHPFALEFNRDSIVYRSNYHPSDEACFSFDADTLKSIVIGDIDKQKYLQYNNE